MNKRNYQKELDDIIKCQEKPKTLFLHSCCAPCSSYVLEYLSKYFEITVFYYNPNISPESEYRNRVREIQRLIRENEKNYENKVSFIEGSYDPEVFYEMARGMEDLPERGKRCYHCYELRMRESAKMAAEMGADYYTTTLSISPYKMLYGSMRLGNVLQRNMELRIFLLILKNVMDINDRSIYPSSSVYIDKIIVAVSILS